MRILVVTPDRNTAGKADYTGAFLPESMAFERARNLQGDTVAVRRLDVSKPRPEKRAAFLAALDAGKGEPWGAVAFFCHGLRSGLPQFAIGLGDVVAMATKIASTKHPGVRVPIYACSTAGGLPASTEGEPGGDGGFADKLRDALCAAGAVDCVVDAHRTAGHATQNPNVVRFAGLGMPTGGSGGKWIVAPGSPSWRKWRARLATDLRFRFPFMSIEEIEAELKP